MQTLSTSIDTHELGMLSLSRKAASAIDCATHVDDAMHYRTNMLECESGRVARASGEQGAQTSLARLLALVGGQHFGFELFSYLHDLSGADQLSIFALHRGHLELLAFFSLHNRQLLMQQSAQYASSQRWRSDPMMRYAMEYHSSNSYVLRKHSQELSCHELADDYESSIVDRVLIGGCTGDVSLCLSMLKSKQGGLFTDAQMDRITGVSDLLFEIIARHALTRSQIPNPAAALRSLTDIETCLTAMTDLPRREMEVCARVLLCQTALGISLALGISEESVKTYRGRAYKRLGIGSVRELWMWYLDCWYRWQLERGNRPSCA